MARLGRSQPFQPVLGWAFLVEAPGPSTPMGTVWGAGTWADGVWADGTWADATGAGNFSAVNVTGDAGTQVPVSVGSVAVTPTVQVWPGGGVHQLP